MAQLRFKIKVHPLVRWGQGEKDLEVAVAQLRFAITSTTFDYLGTRREGSRGGAMAQLRFAIHSTTCNSLGTEVKRISRPQWRS